MFKLPNLPNPGADCQELADFAEIRCWIDNTRHAHKSLSESEIVRYLVQTDDNDKNSGCDDSEDAIRDRVSEAMGEISRRAEICRDGYPFHQGRDGQTLKFAPMRKGRKQKAVYLYLLLCTRLNMQKQRMHADLDGTRLLEILSGHVLQTYLGPNSRNLLFGTATTGGFRGKVNDLCQKLGEGGSYRQIDDRSDQAKDGGLDTVGWIPFADRSPGQLIIFGQCKTGTNWRDDTTKLHPENFAKICLSDSFLVDPLRAFFVSESVDRSIWKKAVISAGILFDRCRLVEHSGNLPSGIFSDISIWNKEAVKSVAQSFWSRVHGGMVSKDRTRPNGTITKQSGQQLSG